MNWLLLAAVSAYILLSDVAVKACRRAKKIPCDCNTAPISIEIAFGTPPEGCDVCGIPPKGRDMRNQDINVMALVKGTERYVFLYDDDHQREALQTLGRFASNPGLSFTWYDAAVLSQRVREAAKVQREAEAREINLRR